MRKTILGLVYMCLLLSAKLAYANLQVEAFSLSLPAYSLNNLQLPVIRQSKGLVILPFYFKVELPSNNNTNWGLELYSDNTKVLNGEITLDGIYRGLRGQQNIAENIPLYWQVYAYDLEVYKQWPKPNEIIPFKVDNLNIWGEIYDIEDQDKSITWEEDTQERLIANLNYLGKYPHPNRHSSSSAYIYFGVDVRAVKTSQNFLGNLNLEFITYTVNDLKATGYATPNPVKPTLGQRVYFNFFTEQPDSEITIKILDPTGFPVRTLHNTKYWDCRNNANHLVEGGIYLYQVEVEGRRFFGTVVVIK